MKFYGGALPYKDIMAMPYITFMMFYDYMIYQMNMESDQGRKINKAEENRIEKDMGVNDKIVIGKLQGFIKGFNKI